MCIVLLLYSSAMQNDCVIHYLDTCRYITCTHLLAGVFKEKSLERRNSLIGRINVTRQSLTKAYQEAKSCGVFTLHSSLAYNSRAIRELRAMRTPAERCLLGRSEVLEGRRYLLLLLLLGKRYRYQFICSRYYQKEPRSKWPGQKRKASHSHGDSTA